MGSTDKQILKYGVIDAYKGQQRKSMLRHSINEPLGPQRTKHSLSVKKLTQTMRQSKNKEAEALGRSLSNTLSRPLFVKMDNIAPKTVSKFKSIGT